ncbi:hypothetical protein RP20_CCG026571 [Aedes albopictus]|nr:hypothetical protein RP20_CCG026571 [Aedes albopictus]
MATDIIKGYSHLQQELNKARDNLKDLNENIRKIVGRDPSNTEQYSSGNSEVPYCRCEMMERKRQEVMDSIATIEARLKADLKNLEENANRDRSAGQDETPNSSKMDRMAATEEDEDYQEDDHANSSYDHDEHSDVAEGPALPSALVTPNFKITIHNNEVKQGDKSEPSPKLMRLVDGTVSSSMNIDSTADSASYLTQGENFQITFKTDRNSE